MQVEAVCMPPPSTDRLPHVTPQQSVFHARLRSAFANRRPFVDAQLHQFVHWRSAVTAARMYVLGMSSALYLAR